MALLTIKEMAAELKISLSLAYALVARGEIPCYEIGSCKRIEKEDLKQYLALRRKQAAKRIKASRRHF